MTLEARESAEPGDRPGAGLAPVAPKGAKAARRGRRWLGWVLRLAVPALLLGWLAAFGDVEALADAFSRVSPLAIAGATLVGTGIIALGGLRWRIVMGAFGARRLPPWLTLTRIYFVGHFYNTFVPGTVGGDIVRGIASRGHFGDRLSSYAVVLTERLVGLVALGTLFAAGMLLGPPILSLDQGWPYLAAATLVGCGVAAVGLASGRFRGLGRRIPRVTRPASLAFAYGVSVAGQSLTVSVVWMLARGMDLQLGVPEILATVPLAIMASALPLAVAGVGPREVALVALLDLVGVAPESGLVLSLSFAGVSNILALVGGLLQLLLGRVGTGDGQPRPDGAPPRSASR